MLGAGRSLRILWAFLPLCLLATAGVATADTVILTNGDRLSGSILRMTGGELVLATEHSGEVHVKQEYISEILSSTPVTIGLKNGEILKGKIEEFREGNMLVSASGGRDMATVRWTEVETLNPPEKKPARLKGNINVGGTLQDGNTDRSSATIGLEATRREERHRFSLEFLHNYAEEDGEVTTRSTFGLFKYDYFFTTKIYGYLATEFLKDKFKDLNLRTVVGPGVGYQIWDSERRSLAVEGGIAYFNEDRIEAPDDHWMTGRLAGNFRYRFTEGVEFSEKLTVFPNLERFGEYTLRNEAAVSSRIVSDFSLRLASIIEYDSDPSSEEVEKTDYTWIVGLQYGF